MTNLDRKLLRKLTAGDVFHARGNNGERLLCLAVHVGETAIDARTVTGQIPLRFDRSTGAGWWGDVKCRIDSVKPLPPEIHNALLGLDRKYRLEADDEQLRLSDAERKALLFVASHYGENEP
jgi:hypothetical protein